MADVLLALLAGGIAVVALSKVQARAEARAQAGPRPSGSKWVTKEEFHNTFAPVHAMARPTVPLTPRPFMQPTPLESRIGGQPWCDAAWTWPLSPSGAPLAFLAQINFADMQLPQFPSQGLLQIFYDPSGPPDTQRGTLEARWIAEPVAGTVAAPPESLPPFPYWADRHGYPEGLALRPGPVGLMGPCRACPLVEEVVAPLNGRLGETREISDAIDYLHRGETRVPNRLLSVLTADRPSPAHYVGGHPFCLKENDGLFARTDPAIDGYDRLLLAIGTDEHVILDNGAGLNIMIRQVDLDRRDFSRVIACCRST